MYYNYNSKRIILYINNAKPPMVILIFQLLDIMLLNHIFVTDEKSKNDRKRIINNSE